MYSAYIILECQNQSGPVMQNVILYHFNPAQ